MAISRDPAPKVGPFSKVSEIAGRTTPANTTEFATTTTEIAPFVESTTADTIVPQEDSCKGTDKDSPFTDDVVAAWNFLVVDSGKSSCTKHDACRVVHKVRSAVLMVYVDPTETIDLSCREIAMFVKEKVTKCHPNFFTRERTGGRVFITLARKSFVFITTPSQSGC